MQGREVDGIAGARDQRRDCALAGHAGGQEGDAPYGGVGRPQPLHLLPRWRLQGIRLSRPRQRGANINTILSGRQQVQGSKKKKAAFRVN